MLIKTLISCVIFALIYFGIAVGLIFIGKPKEPDQTGRRIAFDELVIDYSRLPKLNTFTARNNTSLSYRVYPSKSSNALIPLHGSGGHSRYFLALAEFISSEGSAQVYAPDLRGHGSAPERRGDVDYIGQLEDDLADFIASNRKDNPGIKKLIVGGHSSGGGLAIRFAGSRYGKQADAYLLLSPFLRYNAPTMRANSGEWARPYTQRIIGLTLLNNVGIHRLDYLTAMEFNMPQEVRDGTETLAYSHRLNTSYAPRDYKKDLKAATQPILVVAGTKDEAFIADQFEPVFSSYTNAQVRLLPGVTHMGLVVGPEIRPVVKEWL